MFCPNCKADMNQYNKNGIIIDACPHCQGIWLDRGELEKILEQERHYIYDHNQVFDQHYGHHDKHYEKHHDKHHDYHNGKYNDYKQHKRKKGIFGILEDIFD